jgi:hypothetical protein
MEGPGAKRARCVKRALLKLEQLSLPVATEVLRARTDAVWEVVAVAEAAAGAAAWLPDVVYEDGEKSDKALYALFARAKGRLAAAAVTNKVNLHEALMRADADMVAASVVVPAGLAAPPPLPGPGVWIWRPEGGWSGHGVAVVAEQPQLDAAWAAFERGKQAQGEKSRRGPRGRDDRAERALLSQYITNPLLMPGAHPGEGLKFHVRLHLLVVASPLGKRAALFRRGEIVRAEEPFRLADYGRDKVHDTHMRYNTPRMFPDDFPGGEAVASQFHAIVCRDLERVLHLTMDQVTKYPEGDSGFELFGCDLMVDETGRVYLIECVPAWL